MKEWITRNVCVGVLENRGVDVSSFGRKPGVVE